MAELPCPTSLCTNSSLQTQHPPRSNGGPITFGIEIESVFAFHQNLLQSVLKRYYRNHPVIVKELPDSAHLDCFLNEEAYSHTCRNLYPSWGLQVDPNTDRSIQFVGQQSTSIIGLQGKVRRYLAEPLVIAREIIGDTAIPVQVQAQLRRCPNTTYLDNTKPASFVALRAQSAKYQTWTLTTDHTLIGCLENQLYDALGEQIYSHTSHVDSDGTVRKIREREWDSSGFELISPVFAHASKNAAFDSISQILTRLSTGPYHQTIPSVWASLQVHIGLDCSKSQKNHFPILQHLGYILLCHEDLISKLHPRSRCGLPLKQTPKLPEEASESHEDDFDLDIPIIPEKTLAERAAENEQYIQQDNQRVLAAESEYTGYSTTNSNLRYFCHATSSTYPPTLSHIQTNIFKPNITLPQLVSLLQKPSLNPSDAVKGHRYRGYMYNFDNILTQYLDDQDTWKTGKPTIEFRQHACSTSAEEIKRWVELCFALVELAQSMSRGAPVLAGRKWPCETVEEFLGEDFLQFNQEDIQYWLGRYEKFKDDRPIEEEIDHTLF